jgi:hypothetical protein
MVAPRGPSSDGPEATPAMTPSGFGGGGPEAASVITPSGSGGGGPEAAQVEAKKTTTPMPDQKAVAKKTTVTMEWGGTGGGRFGAAQAGVEGAPDAMPDLKVVAKRPMTVMGSGGSSPPYKRLHTTWTCQGPRYITFFLKIFFFSLSFLFV